MIDNIACEDILLRINGIEHKDPPIPVKIAVHEPLAKVVPEMEKDQKILEKIRIDYNRMRLPNWLFCRSDTSAAVNRTENMPNFKTTLFQDVNKKSKKESSPKGGC